MARKMNVRPDRRKHRQVTATERATPQTPEQRIATLDARLGVGVGAKRERARLASK